MNRPHHDTPRVQAVYAFLRELGLPTARLSSFEAQVTQGRVGDYVAVRYTLVADDELGEQ